MTVNVDGETVRFFHAINKGVHRVFIDHPWFLAKVWGKTGSKLYGPKSGADYLDNHKRFAIFCKAAIEATKALPFGPGEECVFVANDWHSALVPVMLKVRCAAGPQEHGTCSAWAAGGMRRGREAGAGMWAKEEGGGGGAHRPAWEKGGGVGRRCGCGCCAPGHMHPSQPFPFHVPPWPPSP